MNKFIFYLILALLLGQCFTADGDGNEPVEQPDVTECNAAEEEACTNIILTDSDYKCVFGKKDNEATEDTCNKVPKTCDDYTEGITEEKCNEFLTDNTKNKCAFIPSAAESSTGKCETQLRACGEEVTGVTMNQEVCEARSSEGKICYLDGTTCKEASNCADIQLSSPPPDELCGKFKPENAKCVPSGNNCIVNPLCGTAIKSTPEEDCGKFALEDPEKVCVSKSDTNCEEITPEEVEAKICSQIETEDACKIIFNNNIFYECEWQTEDTTGSCKFKEKHSTCSSAATFKDATNVQCNSLEPTDSKFCIKGPEGCLEVAKCEDATGETIENDVCKSIKIQVQSYQECVKGTSGCEIKPRSCTDSTIVYEEGICEHLKPDEDKQCYYDGAKCTQADSCANVAATTLAADKMSTVCSLFNEEKKNCIPDGNKCKLQAESSSGEGDNDNKDTTKATQSGNEDSKDTTKATQSGNEDSKDTTKATQSGNEDSKDTTKATQSGNESGSDTTKATQGGNESGSDATKATDGEKNEDGDGEEGSSSGFVSFSFLLFSILTL